MLMLTWSSLLADVGIVSTLAGCASVLISEVRAAAVTCAIMKPEWSPLCAREERRQVAQRGVHQAVAAPLADGGELRGRQAHDVGRDRHRRAVEVAARDDVARVGEHHRVVGRRVGLDRDGPAGERDRVARRAVHLRRAAQRVGVLHLAAVLVRLVDAAAGERARGCWRPSACWPACGRGVVNARLEGMHRAAERVERERPATSAARASRSACTSARPSTAVDACVPLMSARPSFAASAHGRRCPRCGARRCRAGAARMVAPGGCSTSPSPISTSARWASGARSPDAPTEPRLGHDRVDAAIQHLDERRERLEADAGESLRQHVGAQHHHGAHGGDVERFTHSRRVAAQQVDLQRREVVRGDPDVGQRPETGVDAVRRLGAGGLRVDDRPCCGHPAHGLGRDLNVGAGLGDVHHLLERQRVAVQARHAADSMSRRGAGGDTCLCYNRGPRTGPGANSPVPGSQRASHVRQLPSIMNIAVLGAQWGDEGKGKIVDLLTPHFSIVARYQGGHNAGHTVLRARHEVRAAPHPLGHPAPGDDLRHRQRRRRSTRRRCSRRSTSWQALGIDVGDAAGRISDRAHLILPYHRELDVLSEARRGERKIGTTSRGIGPAYEDKIGRRGIRVGDLGETRSSGRRPRRRRARERRDPQPADRRQRTWTGSRCSATCATAWARLRPWVRDVSLFLAEARSGGQRDAVRGRPGHAARHRSRHLSRTSPRRTRRSAGCCTGLGVAPKAIDGVLGVVKAYTTRVGEGPLPTELHGRHGRAPARERATSSARSPAGRGAAAGSTPSSCATRRGSTASTPWRSPSSTSSTASSRSRCASAIAAADDCCASSRATSPSSSACEPVYDVLPGWDASDGGRPPLRRPAGGGAPLHRAPRGGRRRARRHRVDRVRSRRHDHPADDAVVGLVR